MTLYILFYIKCISIEPVYVLTLFPSTLFSVTYGNVINFTCQTNGTQLIWIVNGSPVINTNNDISVYTTNTADGILSVLTIRAVPISGIDQITIGCALTAPVFQVKLTILTIIGTISLL